MGGGFNVNSVQLCWNWDGAWQKKTKCKYCGGGSDAGLCEAQMRWFQSDFGFLYQGNIRGDVKKKQYIKRHCPNRREGVNLNLDNVFK